MQKAVKVIVGFAWLSVVGYYYFFKNHPYYMEAGSFAGRIVGSVVAVLIGIALIAGLQLAWNYLRKKDLKEFGVSAWKVVAMTLLMAISVLTAYQLSADLAFYSGDTIFQDNQSWGLLPEGAEASGDMTIILQKDSIANSSSSLIEILPAEIQEYFTEASAWRSAVFVTRNVVWNLLLMLIFTLASCAIGHRILRFTKIGAEWTSSKPGLSQMLLSIVAGLIAYMMLVFVLALFGAAHAWAVFGGITLMAIISYEDLWGFAKFIATKASSSIKINPKSLPFWTVVSAGIMAVYNILDIIRPMPIGWDDSNHYLYISEKIAQTGSLLESAGGMYNWELINAIGSYTSSATLPLFINFCGGLLAIASLYLVLQIFMKKDTAVMLTSFFYIIPSVVFQSATDLKNDLALMFFVLMGLYAAIEWWKSGKNQWLYLAAAIMGISIGIKITAGIALMVLIAAVAGKSIGKKGALGTSLMLVGVAIFMVGAGDQYGVSIETAKIVGIVMMLSGLILGVLSFRESKPQIGHLKVVAISAVIIVLAVLPWVIKNTLIDDMALNISNYHASRADIYIMDLDMAQTCETETLGDEFSDYVVGRGNSEQTASIVSLLKMPWQMTMNTGFTGLYIDMTFVFLGLLPLLLWYLIEQDDKAYRRVFWAAVLYFVILTLFFNGVVWYGYVGLSLLLILIGKMTESYGKDTWQGDRVLSLAPKIAIGITAFSVVIIRMASFGSIEELAYLGSIIDDDQYISSISPGILETVAAIEADNDPNLIIYRIGGATSYYLAGENAKFIYDESLDTFACMQSKYAGEEIATILSEEGVDYVAFDYTYALGAEYGDPTAARYADFFEFGKSNLETVVEDGDYILFKVEDQE